MRHSAALDPIVRANTQGGRVVSFVVWIGAAGD
jgi:hypothetical protein